MAINAEITGCGKYVPKHVVTNSDLEARIDTSDQWIRERTGIRERRIAEAGENTSHMAIAAGREALEAAKVTPESLDLVIVATSSPDYLVPPVSSQVQHELGAANAGAFTVAVGCWDSSTRLSSRSSLSNREPTKKFLLLASN